MGASTSILYLSEKFRSNLISWLGEKKSIKGYSFLPQEFARGVILDSPFGNLQENMVNFVSSKAPNVPEILIRLAIKIIESKKSNIHY